MSPAILTLIGGMAAAIVGLLATTISASINARTEHEAAHLEATPYSAISARVTALEKQLAALESQVRELEADRAADRRWITSAIAWMARAAQIIAAHPDMPRIAPPPEPPDWHLPPAHNID